jgi:hypothetical protein
VEASSFGAAPAHRPGLSSTTCDNSEYCVFFKPVRDVGVSGASPARQLPQLELQQP